jgi:hypothetical protein
VGELQSFGLTEENMNVLSEIWTLRYPDISPSLNTKDQFVGVLRDGLLKLVAEAANDPIVVFQKQVDSMVESLRKELEAIMSEPMPEPMPEG